MEKNSSKFSKFYIIIAKYLVIFLVVLALFLSIKFLPQRVWMLDLVFLGSIFLPGYFLAKFFKWRFDGLLHKLIIWLTIGFVYIFSISLISIFLSFRIDTLVLINFVLLILMFLYSGFLDISKTDKKDWDKPDWKKFFRTENLIYLVVFLAVFFVFCAIDQQGANLKGDPQYHLAIMRKVVGNEPFSVNGLSYVKDTVELAYAFPIWHIFLGAISKITNFTTFAVFTNIPAILFLVMSLIWFWTFRQITNNKYLAGLATILFLAINFASNKGYLFTRLPVPDSFNQFILLPITTSLAINYIFKNNSKNKDCLTIILVSILVLLMAVIHVSQYVYFMLAMLLLLLVYTLTMFRTINYKETIMRIVKISVANLLVIVPALILLEIKSHNISHNLLKLINEPVKKGIQSSSFEKINLYAKISYLLLPVSLIFVKKQNRIVFIISMFLVPIIVFFGPIKFWLTKVLSNVFMDRLFYNMVWYPVVLAVFIGFIFMLVDRFLTGKGLIKYVRWLIEILLIILLFIGFKFEKTKHYFLNLYNCIFTNNLSHWLDKNYIWIFLVILFVVLISLFLIKRSQKNQELFIFNEPKNVLISILLIILIGFLFFSSNFVNLRNYYKREIRDPQIFNRPRNGLSSLLNPVSIGGMETVDFINKNIPTKVVFDANGAFYALPMLCDVYMSNYDSTAATNFKMLYRPTEMIEAKISVIFDKNIEYLLIINKLIENRDYFDRYPMYFEKVYDSGTAIIYKFKKDSKETQEMKSGIELRVKEKMREIENNNKTK